MHHIRTLSVFLILTPIMVAQAQSNPHKPTIIVAPIAVPTIPPPATPEPTPTPPPSPTPSEPAPSKKASVKLQFRINLNLTDMRTTEPQPNAVIRTTVQAARGESVVIGGIMRNFCKPKVCNEENECQEATCENVSQDIRLTFIDLKNDVVHCKFEVLGPRQDRIGFVVSGRVNSTLTYKMSNDLKVNLSLTPSMP